MEFQNALWTDLQEVLHPALAYNVLLSVYINVYICAVSKIVTDF